MTDARPKLTQSVRKAFNAQLIGLGFNAPGIVTSFADGVATVQPAIGTMTIDGVKGKRSELKNVPILWPTGGGLDIRVVAEKGDEVFLHIAGRSMDRFKAEGGVGDPGDARLFHTSDVVAYPAAISKPNRELSVANSLDYYIGLRDGLTGLGINKDGRISLGNGVGEVFTNLLQASEALVSLLEELPEYVKKLNAAEAAKTAAIPTMGEIAAEEARKILEEAATALHLGGATTKAKAAVTGAEGVKI